MASLVAKKKGHKLYYYLVESARVGGQPRITRQQYLGTAEKIAALVQQNASPTPAEVRTYEFGLVAALWRAAEQSGMFALLESLWPTPRSGPSLAHYLLLAAIHRICAPGPKTDVAEWYHGTVLEQLWGIPAARFSSQAFWDAFDLVHLDPIGSAPSDADDLERAQSKLLALWKGKQLVSERLLSYDTTNFYTYIASTNQRNTIAQRGHNKQGRHNLRQVGLSYILDGVHGLSLCHHVYPGNDADPTEFCSAMPRLMRLLDENEIPRDSVTVVFDKGTAALDNTIALEEMAVGWISALPWTQVPKQFRETPLDKLVPLSSRHPGVQAIAERIDVHGKERLCVLKYSASFLSEQLHSLTTSLAKVTQSLRRLSQDLAKPSCRLTEAQVQTKIDRWLAPQFLGELIRYSLRSDGSRLQLQYDVDTAGFHELLTRRLGRTVLVTNRVGWSPEQVVAAYAAQQHVERVFRGLKDGQCVWRQLELRDRDN